jgi:hypothetical protein
MTTQAYRISNYYTIGKGTVTKLSINGYEEKT